MVVVGAMGRPAVQVLLVVGYLADAYPPRL
jgi:hypothetical protein